MPSLKADLLLHPTRMKILTSLSNQQLTASEIAKMVPDVPLTTLYRHINKLVEGGILQVADETQIRGTVERSYTLTSLPSLTADDLEGMKKQDYQQAFIVYLSSLMSAAQRYLDSKGDNEEFNPLDDGMDLSLGTLYLSDEEFKELNKQILALILAAANNQPEGGRTPRMFTYLFVPQ